MSTMSSQLVRRSIARPDLVTTLRHQNDAKLDVVISATGIHSTEDQQNSVLDHYLGGGQRTAGGILQAITSAAQVQDDADSAYDLERGSPSVP
ncbi:MAG TPA: hypothetical protein VI357_28330 [Mycobacteriales bacterium]